MHPSPQAIVAIETTVLIVVLGAAVFKWAFAVGVCLKRLGSGLFACVPSAFCGPRGLREGYTEDVFMAVAVRGEFSLTVTGLVI